VIRRNALLSRAVTLACFSFRSSGWGNIGTQAATIMARGLSTGRISLRLVGEVIFKEIRIALLLGLSTGPSWGRRRCSWSG